MTCYWLFLTFLAISHCNVINVPVNGLELTASDASGRPSIRFNKPGDKPEYFGTYDFTFLGLAEADSTEPLTLKNETRFEPTGWVLSPLIKSKDSKFVFSYTSDDAKRLKAMRIVAELYESQTIPGATQIGLHLWLEGYEWVLSDPYGYLILTFRLNNTLNTTAAITRPDRIQASYGYLSSPQFAQASLYNGSDVERVPVRFYVPIGEATDPDVYWIVYERFSQNLLHKAALGYGLEARPNLATITGLTCFGIIVLSCCVIALVIFGRKIDKRYGKKFAAMTSGGM